MPVPHYLTLILLYLSVICKWAILCMYMNMVVGSVVGTLHCAACDWGLYDQGFGKSGSGMSLPRHTSLLSHSKPVYNVILTYL